MCVNTTVGNRYLNCFKSMSLFPENIYDLIFHFSKKLNTTNESAKFAELYGIWTKHTTYRSFISFKPMRKYKLPRVGVNVYINYPGWVFLMTELMRRQLYPLNVHD